MSIFNKAKKAPKKKAATKQKLQVTPKFDTEDEVKDFNEKLDKFATLKTKITELTAEYKSVESDIKEISTEEVCNLLEKNGKKESFNIVSEAGGSVMVVPQDKYITIDEERAEYLNDTYGTFDEDENLIDGIVDEKTEFKFNMKVLERNQKVIEKFFEECDDISESDKEDLIECTTKYTVKKGTIDKLSRIAEEKETDIPTLYEEVRPVLQLKNASPSK